MYLPTSHIICCWHPQVKKIYVNFLYHCYIDTEVDNKETFTKEHIWVLFKSFAADIGKVKMIFMTGKRFSVMERDHYCYQIFVVPI